MRSERGSSTILHCLQWYNRRGSRILQERVSIPSERGTGGRVPKAQRGVWGGVCAPSPENFCISCIKMMSFCAFSVINTVTANRHVLKTCSFQKGHPNQKGGCPDTLDTSPSNRPCISSYILRTRLSTVQYPIHYIRSPLHAVYM